MCTHNACPFYSNNGYLVTRRVIREWHEMEIINELPSKWPSNRYLKNVPRPWASYPIRKIGGCACSGNVFPTTYFKGNRKLAIPACITARAWCTYRNDAGISNPRRWGKRSRHSRRMRNPQFYVFGKRLIVTALRCLPSHLEIIGKTQLCSYDCVIFIECLIQRYSPVYQN